MFKETKVEGVDAIFLQNEENSMEKVLLEELEETQEYKDILSTLSKKFLEVGFNESSCRDIVEGVIKEKELSEEEAIKIRELSHMLYRL